MSHAKPVSSDAAAHPSAQRRRRPLRSTLPLLDVNDLRSVLDAMPAVVWITDNDLRIVDAFGNGLRIVGADPEQMIGQPLADAFGCGQIDEIVRGTSAALKGETEQFECVWADKMYEAEVRPIVDADGSVTGAFGVALDVTERNESTDRLRRLAAVIDAADDAIVAIGSDGRIRSWNRGAEELFGYRQAAVVGQPLADLFVERDDVLSNLERVLAGDHIVARVMVRTPRSDQRPRRISATLSPIKNGAGRAIGVAAIIRAQRDEIAAQTHLLQAQKVEAISRLASGVAHDFNNLLTVLQVYGELLRNQLPPHWPAQEDLTVIMNATRSAADMTRELLAFSRGEAAGKPEI